MFFFFKQKTAYEMRISDWSSDVCSSDLRVVAGLDDDAVDQVLDTDTLADLDEHLRSALAPRLLAYRKRVVERETAVLEPRKQHVDGHHLGHRRRFHQLIRILRQQY